MANEAARPLGGSICLAYRLNDQIFARCGSTTRSITRTRELLDFAIHGDAIVLLRPPHAYDGMDITVAGHAQPTPELGPSVTYASCGTILAMLDTGPPAWDVLRGQPFAGSRLLRPACSENLSIAVVPGRGGSGLIVEPGGIQLPGKASDLKYGISPNGMYAAYTYEANQDYRLCTVRLPGGMPTCQPVGHDTIYASVLAVSDAGDVAYVSARWATERCYYYGAANQNVRHTPPGGQDECFGIFVASATHPPKLLIPDGSNPQWVSRSTVDELIATIQHPKE